MNFSKQDATNKKAGEDNNITLDDGEELSISSDHILPLDLPLTEDDIPPDFSTFTSNPWTELWKGLNSSTNIDITTMSTVTLPPFNGSELLNNVGSVAKNGTFANPSNTMSWSANDYTSTTTYAHRNRHWQ
jgi:hypothetical protein